MLRPHRPRARLALAALATLAIVLPPRRVAAQAAMALQQTEFRGFTDVTFGASRQPGEHAGFALGQFDLYITSRLADQLTFLGETVFEYDGGDFGVDVERLSVTYAPREYFRVSVGKHHTPIGYWNTAYHHGRLMQPAITRPMMFRFEDEGGILPVHTVGVAVAGQNISPLHLGYDVMVGNGVGASPEGDNDNAKSVTLAAHSRLTSAFTIGASFNHDRIATGTLALTGDSLPEPVTQRVAGGYLAYTGSPVELIAEYQRITHTSASTGSHATDAYVGHAGYRFGTVVPYVEHDVVQSVAGDPYYPLMDLQRDILGARYELSMAASLRLELQRRKLAAGDYTNDVVAQIAIGF